jgi:hypothetical protein
LTQWLPKSKNHSYWMKDHNSLIIGKKSRIKSVRMDASNLW